MRKFALTTIVVVLAAMAVLLLLSAARAETWYAFCSPDSYINVRQGAGSQHALAGTLQCGETYEVSDTCKDKRGRTWLKSETPHYEAAVTYVCATYMSRTPVTVETCTVRVDEPGRVAIRKTPGGDRVAWAHEGDTLEALAYNEEWALTTKGFVSMKYILWLGGTEK